MPIPFPRRLAAQLLLLLPSWLEAGSFGHDLIVCDASTDRLVRLSDRDQSGLFEVDSPREVTPFYDDASPGPDLSSPNAIVPEEEGAYLVLDGGSLDEILLLLDQNDDGDANDEGEVHVYYDASAGGPKLSTPKALLSAPSGVYVADDGSATRRLLRLVDLNRDHDALDDGEATVVYDASALSLPVLGDLEALASGLEGRLYAADVTLQAIYRLDDQTEDGDFLDLEEVHLFHQTAGENAFTDISGLAWDGQRLFVSDAKTGRILVLEDKNGDGDAEDEGEAQEHFGGSAAVRSTSITGILHVPGKGLLALDNSKDSVLQLVDRNGDGDANDAGESARILVDKGETLGSPTGLAAVSPRNDPVPQFVRGDASADGRLDLSDPVTCLGYLFLGRPVTTCLDAFDADDSGGLNISDAVYLLNFLFGGGRVPPAPYPDAGLDPTRDSIDC